MSSVHSTFILHFYIYGLISSVHSTFILHFYICNYMWPHVYIQHLHCNFTYVTIYGLISSVHSKSMCTYHLIDSAPDTRMFVCVCVCVCGVSVSACTI